MDNRVATDNHRIPIGLDPGFGGTKAAYVGAEGARVASVPSVVGVGQTDLGMLSIGTLSARSRSRQPDQMTFGGVTYLVGEKVERYARPVERMDFSRLSDGPELRGLVYDVIFRLLGKGEHQATIMVGMPVEVMADRDMARDTLKSLRRWMVGEHEFTVNGHETHIDIKEVQVMAQPTGAFFCLGPERPGQVEAASRRPEGAGGHLRHRFQHPRCAGRRRWGGGGPLYRGGYRGHAPGGRAAHPVGAP